MKSGLNVMLMNSRNKNEINLLNNIIILLYYNIDSIFILFNLIYLNKNINKNINKI